MQPDQIVAELLARGDINDETTLELNRLADNWRAGTLDPDDEGYLRALHARLMHLEPQPMVDEAPRMSAPNTLDGLTIEDWRERALRAEAELAQLQEAAQNG